MNAPVQQDVQPWLQVSPRLHVLYVEAWLLNQRIPIGNCHLLNGLPTISDCRDPFPRFLLFLEVCGGPLVIQLKVTLLIHLQHILRKATNSGVPMPGAFLIKWVVNDREYRLGIQPGQAATVHEVLVFPEPEKESTFNDLDRVSVETTG